MIVSLSLSLKTCHICEKSKYLQNSIRFASIHIHTESNDGGGGGGVDEIVSIYILNSESPYRGTLRYFHAGQKTTPQTGQ